MPNKKPPARMRYLKYYYYTGMDEKVKNRLVDTIIRGLPGKTSETYTMATFTNAVEVNMGGKIDRIVYIF